MMLLYLATKMKVSTQQVLGAKNATSSIDRIDIEKYIFDKGAKEKEIIFDQYAV